MIWGFIWALIFSAFFLEIGQQAGEATKGGANHQITTSLTRQLQYAKGAVSQFALCLVCQASKVKKNQLVPK